MCRTNHTLYHTHCVHIPSQVLMVLANIGEALISFDKHVTSMFTSGSMITVVAQLLNHPTRISRVLNEATHASNPSSGGRTSSASISDSEQDEEEIGELRDVT